MPHYFVRIGALAEIYSAVAGDSLAVGQRVIVRSPRGVELGEVVGSCKSNWSSAAGELTILRPTTDADELLIQRLDRYKREAVEACRQQLREVGSTATLLDVDQLFDGGTLIMHFLGEIDQIAQESTRQVAQRYESIVRSEQFAERLSQGCGPDCGSAEQGCGDACAGCAVATACSSR